MFDEADSLTHKDIINHKNNRRSKEKRSKGELNPKIKSVLFERTLK